MITKLKEQVNKALSESHGQGLTYDQLYTYRFLDSNDQGDRCKDFNSHEELETSFTNFINNNEATVVIYIQIDDSDIFKAHVTKLDPTDDVDDLIHDGCHRFNINNTLVYIVID